MATTKPDGSTTTADPPAEGKLGERVEKIENEQREQRGILDQILAKVSGGKGPDNPAPSPSGGAVQAVSPVDIQAQVRKEIADADARRQREQDETKWRDEVSRTVEQVKREHQPREPEAGPRGFLQRLTIGRPQ